VKREWGQKGNKTDIRLPRPKGTSAFCQEKRFRKIPPHKNGQPENRKFFVTPLLNVVFIWYLSKRGTGLASYVQGRCSFRAETRANFYMQMLR